MTRIRICLSHLQHAPAIAAESAGLPEELHTHMMIKRQEFATLHNCHEEEEHLPAGWNLQVLGRAV